MIGMLTIIIKDNMIEVIEDNLKTVLLEQLFLAEEKDNRITNKMLERLEHPCYTSGKKIKIGEIVLYGLAYVYIKSVQNSPLEFNAEYKFEIIKIAEDEIDDYCKKYTMRMGMGTQPKGAAPVMVPR